MANYEGNSRSNYFRVKDEQAFRAWCERLEIDLLSHDDDPHLFAITPFDDTGSWPSEDPETGEPLDFLHELAGHLDPGHVAILVHTGHEKLRYLSARAFAINAAAQILTVDIDDIYELAEARFGNTPAISRAEY